MEFSVLVFFYGISLAIFRTEYSTGEAMSMPCSYRRVLITWFAILFAAAAAMAQEQNGRAIKGFDINKVRELSENPKALSPSADSTAAPTSAREAPNYTFIVFRIVLSLVIIIALIFGVSWLIRKSGLAGTSRIGGGGSMDVLEVLPLGPNRNVVLFRVIDTVYLCGQTASNISMIDKIDGQRAVDLLTSSKGPSTVVHFKEAFNQFISKMKK
jgi:flagellar biosynthetic protein FliO